MSLTNAEVAAKYGVSANDVSNRKKTTIKRESKRTNVSEQDYGRSLDEARVTNGSLTAKEAARNGKMRGDNAQSAESRDAAVGGADSEQSVDVGMSDDGSADLADLADLAAESV